MSAETFVFTQLQSGALPTELSEANLPTRLHYLTLINANSGVLNHRRRGSPNQNVPTDWEGEHGCVEEVVKP